MDQPVQSSQERIEDVTFESLIRDAFKARDPFAVEMYCFTYGYVLEGREQHA